ncbi:substrate-binding periplasmic protein [Roseibium hamelinense]|nr:transporter substrate-binding domain-containing protein [Roseibium hamelinense]
MLQLMAFSVLLAVVPAVHPTNASDLKILTTIAPPTNYVEQGQLVGTSVDIVRELDRRLGRAHPIEVLPAARALKIVETTRDTAFFTAGKTAARVEHGYHFIGPLITRAHMLYARSGSDLAIANLRQIADMGLTVAGILGDWRTAYLEEQGIVVETNPVHEMNVKKLLLGRNDLWISSDIEALPNLSLSGAKLSDVQPVFVLREASSYLIISKQTDRETVAAWQDAFASLQQDAVFSDQLTRKWSEKLGFEIGFSKEKGVYPVGTPLQN